MLRRETRCGFERSGSWVFKRYEFRTAKLGSLRKLTQDEYDELRSQQSENPVSVLRDITSRRTWWMFKDEYYSETESLGPTEVKALIVSKERSKKRRIERAMAEMEADEYRKPSAKRKPIPQSVRNAVWNRDNGRCVECGSNKKLEYDHIIPVARGGSDTVRNLQLLCETCNRRKGTDGLVDFAETSAGPGTRSSSSRTKLDVRGATVPVQGQQGTLKLPDDLLGKKGAALYSGVVKRFVDSGLASATVVVPGVTHKRLFENLKRAVDRSDGLVSVSWPAGKKVTLQRMSGYRGSEN